MVTPDDTILKAAVAQIIRDAQLREIVLPRSSAIRLLLLDGDYPQGELSSDEMRKVMDNPLYWVFCWASGQVLAEFLLEKPHWVADKRVLDFGSGSGVVAIAAALAGAREVIACDCDPLALEATRVNAARNGVEVQTVQDFHAVRGAVDLIIVADVLYDRANLHWLTLFAQRADDVLLADSRIKDFDHPRYKAIARETSCTVPDLDESAQFRDVRIYCSV
ncbi:MAG: 50S ribosomal protein L11 methyltransferase [Pseudomonadota bacterium]